MPSLIPEKVRWVALPQSDGTCYYGLYDGVPAKKHVHSTDVHPYRGVQGDDVTYYLAPSASPAVLAAFNEAITLPDLPLQRGELPATGSVDGCVWVPATVLNVLGK